MPTPLADTLWHANLDLACACLADPFVAGLATGATSRERFAWYVGQDAAFLDVFARAYALALARSPDRAQLLEFTELLQGVVAELRLHGAYAARWGIDLDAVEPGPACLAYTDFLRAVAALEPLPQVMAAMAPCMRLYAWLGRELLPLLDPASPYAEWVRTYADPAFQALAGRVDALLSLPGGDGVAMAARYRRAMSLELAFFRACGTAGRD
jgi:thiaminase/transcriptional activator TenA